MFEWLKTFIVVYETRNFSEAAKRLFMSQPTVSLQIQKLENHLGLKLFERSGKQMIVSTKEADFLYPKVLNVMEELTDSFIQVSNKENFKMDCILACSNTTAIYLVPEVMPKLIEAFPLINFSIQMMNSKEVIGAIQNNYAQIGFLERTMEAKNIKRTRIYEDELVFAGDPNAKFWILREKDSGIRFINEIFLHEEGLDPLIMHVNNNELLQELLKKKVGKAIVSKLMVSDEIAWQEMDHHSSKRDIYLVKNLNNTKKEIEEIYQFVADFFASYYLTNNKKSL